MGESVLSRLGRKLLNIKYCGAVIVAAGSASRMEGIDKVMAPLNGEPMIVRSVRVFQNCEAIQEIVVVTREDLVIPVTKLCKDFSKVTAVVAGGSSRPESVNLGLSALSRDVNLAAVHDGARPLIAREVIERTVRAAGKFGAAAPAVPVKDTVKIVGGEFVKKTPDRSQLYAVQTPQIFDFDLLRGALQKAASDGKEITDDCSAVEYLGMSVKIVAGDERNLKVTTPMDLKIAQMLLEEEK